MPAHTVDFAALDQLAADLAAAGVASVTTNPADLNLPGVLVQVSGLAFDLLDGYTIRTRLLCVAPDTDPRRAMDQLAALVNTVTSVVDPTDDPTAETVNLPTDATPYPAFAVPFDLPAT